MERSRNNSAKGKQRAKTATFKLDVYSMLEELHKLGKSETDWLRESDVTRDTLGRLKKGESVTQKTFESIELAFRKLTNRQTQFETKPGDLAIGNLLPSHPEYEPVFGSSLNGLVTTYSGITYRQIELKSKVLTNQRARGKIYDMFHLPPNQRDDLFHQVTRHAEVCRMMKGDPNVIANLSAIPLANQEGLYLVDDWYDGDLLADCLKEVVSWSFRDKCKLLGDMIITIQSIHGKNIILRSLSPDSILINRQSKGFCLTNFELSKFVSFGKSVSKEWKPSRYLAPEVSEYNQADFRNDIFSWGILCELLLENEMDSDLMSTSTRSLIKKAIQIVPDNRFKNTLALKSAWDKLKFGTR